MNDHQRLGRMARWTPLALAILIVLAVFVLSINGIAESDPAPDQQDPLPAEKQALVDHEEALIAAARSQPQPPADATKPITTAPAASVPVELDTVRAAAGAGTIVQDGQAPFPSAQFSFRNRWFEVKDNTYITIYAGAEGYLFDSSQGVVVVTVETLDFKPVAEASGTYRTPEKAGPVKVVAADGERLTLVSESGAIFVFDVPSRQFVSALPAAP